MESKTGNVGFRSIFVIALAAAFIVSGFFAPNNVLAEQSPNITIITPDGTTSWRGVQEISWTDVSNSPPYKIFYSSNFSTFQNLISNVSETSFEWDTTGNGEVVGVTDGTYQIKVENLKGEFNVSNQFIIDNTPPTTTIDGIGGTPGNDNWWVSVPSITLHCEDVLSGCNETFYRWNGNPDDPNGFSLYENESSIVDAPEGENVLFFFSTDNARDKEGKNNQEAVKQCNDPDICPDGLIKVDTTFPDIASYTLNGEGANAFFNPVDGQSVDIFITADEPVEYNRIKILDETLTEVKFFTQTGVFQTTASKNWDGTGQTGDGEYTLQVNIEDMAGNTVDDLDLVPHIIVVDTTDPSINSFTEPMDDEVYKDSVPVVFKASDLNGITCAYQVNGDDPVDFACNN
ncbi:MAG: hypothetical protein Q8P35_01690, partial [Candidatus Yanofskybacteria bacterium]|nr:hypothetical protein [Candidatus Yanofskybacteria bacterium]